MSSSLTTLVFLVTLLHVAVFVIMIMIRLRRDEPDGTRGESVSQILRRVQRASYPPGLRRARPE